jgi:phage terminase large subunit-like protein
MGRAKRDPAIERLALLPRAQRMAALRTLNAAEYIELQARWEAYALDGQAEPAGGWRIWTIQAGRGFGKTRAGAEWISARARENPAARIALVGATLAEARRVMVEGESGLIAVARPGEEPKWYPSRGLLVFPSGAEAQIFSAAAPEGLRGPGHHFAWCDELGKWKGDAGIDAWSNLMLTMRNGARPRTMVTTTPRSTALMRRVLAAKDCVQTLGKTRDNPWLAGSFVEAMMADFGGTRLERQELDGELIDEVEGALWNRGLIEARRVAEAPELVRVVVGVDPPASAGGPSTGSGQASACGIVAVGLGRDGCAYVLEDASVSGATPDGWARAVAACAARHGADRVVAEKNQGGDMVATTLRAADSGLPVVLVHASRGKSARAEPVSLLYEAGKAFHAGAFAALEDELCGLQMGGGYEGPGRSPDRADACVWAMTAVMLGKTKVGRVRGL